jgi:DNA-binding transcriptional ArsR family regulator
MANGNEEEAQMNKNAKEVFIARATIMKSLAHPTRLFIVDELSRGERCVREIQTMIGDDLSTISKHLSVLRAAGIVRDEKRGTQVFYSLHRPCVMNFFSCIEKIIRDQARERLSLVGGEKRGENHE